MQLNNSNQFLRSPTPCSKWIRCVSLFSPNEWGVSFVTLGRRSLSVEATRVYFTSEVADGSYPSPDYCFLVIGGGREGASLPHRRGQPRPVPAIVGGLHLHYLVTCPGNDRTAPFPSAKTWENQPPPNGTQFGGEGFIRCWLANYCGINTIKNHRLG